MSAATKQALDEAISLHFTDEHEGALISGYVLQMVGTTIEDVLQQQARYLRCVAEDQPLMTTVGLIEWVRAKIRRHLAAD